MESLFFHPKVVHIPIALALLMPLISLGVWVGWLRKWWSPRTWVVVLGLQVVLVASGIVATQSGEQEEARVEVVVPEAALESHEEAAEQFVWVSGAVALVMAGGVLLGNHRSGHATAAVSMVGTVVVLAVGYRTGQAGGALVYKHAAASAYTSAAVAAPGGQRGENRDDEERD